MCTTRQYLQRRAVKTAQQLKFASAEPGYAIIASTVSSLLTRRSFSVRNALNKCVTAQHICYACLGAPAHL